MSLSRKNKRCVECGREDQPWFSKKRCKSCAQRAYSKKMSEQNINKYTPIKRTPIKKKPRPVSKYKEIYCEYFGVGVGDFIPCEVCEKEAVDIHHIDARGMGGDPTKSKDTIENLMALCRECHTTYGDIKVYKDLLRQIHRNRLS